MREADAPFQRQLVGEVEVGVGEGRAVLQRRRIVDQEVLHVRPAGDGEPLELDPAGVALAGVQVEAAEGPFQTLFK